MNESVNRSVNETGAIPVGKGMEEEGKGILELLRESEIKAERANGSSRSLDESLRGAA